MGGAWAVVILGRKPAKTLLPGPQALEPGSAQNAHRSLQAIRSWLPRNASASLAAGCLSSARHPAVSKCGEATSAGNSLGMPQIRKPLSTAELQSPAHRYNQASTVAWGKQQIPGRTQGRAANACGCELGHTHESRGCLTHENMAGREISHRLHEKPGSLEGRQRTHP